MQDIIEFQLKKVEPHKKFIYKVYSRQKQKTNAEVMNDQTTTMLGEELENRFFAIKVKQ